jgi:superfamily II DNA or RNA helicase
MELRPHQEKAVDMLRDSLRRGKRRPILAAPCSFGKTITAAYIFEEAIKRGKRGIFICDRIKLVEQSLEAFDLHGIETGVMQGNHYRSDSFMPVQIASIQTLARRTRMPDFDFAIVDECHSVHKYLLKMMESYNNIPFIGLSATPFSKNLGNIYDDLIVPCSPVELLEQGYLCPIHYYGGTKVRLDDVRRRALPTGGTDYDPVSLSHKIEKDTLLAGDIVKNWLKHGEDSQTIAFSPSIKHSKYMVDLFRKNGISAEHIDGYTNPDLREVMFRAHDQGEFKILSCSKLLNVGYDAPNVRCLIDCYPTTSKISYIQRAGRIARTAPNKPYAIYLDHSGNVSKHGFAEHCEPLELDTGDRAFSESKQVKQKKESKVWECPECYQQRTGVKCPCGYEIPRMEQLKNDEQILKRMTSVEKANVLYDANDKAHFLGELKLYAKQKGFKDGWAGHIYKQKFGEWPDGIVPLPVTEISDSVRKYIQYSQIRRMHGFAVRRAS